MKAVGRKKAASSAQPCQNFQVPAGRNRIAMAATRATERLAANLGPRLILARDLPPALVFSSPAADDVAGFDIFRVSFQCLLDLLRSIIPFAPCGQPLPPA